MPVDDFWSKIKAGAGAVGVAMLKGAAQMSAYVVRGVVKTQDEAQKVREKVENIVEEAKQTGLAVGVGILAILVLIILLGRGRR